jgi:hypothetical protein
MKEYQTLLSYIEYFTEPSNNFFKWSEFKKDEDGVIALPYCSYSERVLEFQKAVYDTGFVFKGNYAQGVTEKENPLEFIENCDLETLRKLLTFFIRRERFCEGMLASAIKNGFILKILERLKELLDGQ